MTNRFRVVFSGLAALALVVGLAGPTHAATILDTSSPEFLGTINPGTPSGDTFAESYVTFLANMALGTTTDALGQNFVRSNNDLGGGVYPDADLDSKDESGNNTFTLSQSFLYLLGKYDQDNAGTWVWYIGNIAVGEQITIPQNFTTGHGLSHFSLFNPGEEPPGGGEDTVVPEPASLLLLGLGALVAGRRARRRFAA